MGRFLLFDAIRNCTSLTTWDGAKTLVNHGRNYLYLNWCETAGFLKHQQYQRLWMFLLGAGTLDPQPPEDHASDSYPPPGVLGVPCWWCSDNAFWMHSILLGYTSPKTNILKVWKMIFHFKRVIFSFYVNFGGVIEMRCFFCTQPMPNL